MKIVAFAFVFAALMVYGEKPQTQTNPPEQKTAKETKEANGADWQTVVVNEGVSKRLEDGKTLNYLSRLFSPENVPNIALVFIGVAGIVTAIYSLRSISRQVVEMRRQVDVTFGQLRAMHEQVAEMSDQTVILDKSVAAAKDNAAAAKASADALVNSERAWIMVDVRWHDSRVTFFKVHSGAGGVRTSLDIDLVCTNEGSTPAWIIEKKIRLQVANTLSWEPVLAHPDTQFNESYEPVSVRQSSPQYPRWQLNGEGWNEEFCYVYGVVRYTDVFTSPQKPRETWFGFQVSSDGGIGHIASREYNRHT